MSEHVDSAVQPNGAAPTTRRSRSETVISTVDGSVVTFDVVGGEPVSVDVAKMHPNSLLEQATLGVRTSIRLAIQKMEDPTKIVAVLRERTAKLTTGEPTIGTRRTSVKEPDDLTVALSAALGNGKSFDYDAYFDDPKSGCVVRMVKGKRRVYGKDRALDKLRIVPAVKAELDRLAKGRKAVPGAQVIDLSSFASPE